MMMAFYAVQGCQLQIMSGAGVATITTPPSTKLKANGKPVYIGPLTVSVTGFSGAVVTGGGTGTGTINPTSIGKTEGKGIVREGDTSQPITISGVNASGSPATEVTTVKIVSAGQMVTRGE